MIIDTHCHLDFHDFGADVDTVINRAKENNVGIIINIGSSYHGSIESLDIAKKYDNIYATCGVHPHDSSGLTDEQFIKLKETAKDKLVVAIGEVGLDYFRNLSPKGAQIKCFERFIGLSKELDKPLVIHCRDAHDETLAILKANASLKGVIHCFSGDKKFLDEILTLGFYVSFTCNITYPKALNLREIVKRTPIERIMLETDAPYLPPQQFRGQRNEPAYIVYLRDEIAGIKNISKEEVERVTCANAMRFFTRILLRSPEETRQNPPEGPQG